MDFDSLILNILSSNSFKEVEYLCSTIRREETLGMITYQSKRRDGVQCKFLNNLYKYVDDLLNSFSMNTNTVLYYMIDNGGRDIVYLSFPNWFSDKSTSDLGRIIIDINARNDLSHWVSDDVDKFWISVLFTNYVIDCYCTPSFLLEDIIGKEVFIYQTNDYKLTNVNEAEFYSDGIAFDNKVYYYNIFTNKAKIDVYDNYPAFIRIIKENSVECDILYRLDERLAVPKKEFVGYSGVPFAKCYGPNLSFSNMDLKNRKTLVVHINPETQNKLLMVIKRLNNRNGELIWHIEVETIPFITEESSIITTKFIHGLYYPKHNYFTHIDFTINQYDKDKYNKKYRDSNNDTSIDMYTEDSNMHYKIWCVENGYFSEKMWLDLVTVSLSPEYQQLFSEMIDNKDSGGNTLINT